MPSHPEGLNRNGATMAFNYDTGAMTTCGNTLKQIKIDVGDKISQAAAIVNDLVSAGFTTEKASAAYSDQFLQLQQALNSMNDSLDPMGDFLIGYASSVEDMDNQMASGMGA
jgi:uncharacterized protein YukE